MFNTDDVVVSLAAAGAGKTTALIKEMTQLLTVYRPDEIAFVTFTRKGVQQGINQALLANPFLRQEDLVYFRTLHALCFRELNLKRECILTRNNMKEFNKLLGFNVTLRDAYENQTNDDKLLTLYDGERAGLVRRLYEDDSYYTFEYKRITKAYEAFKETRGYVDFYDCLLLFKERNKPVNVKVAFIDEAQDLTLLQWDVCRIAFSACEKVRISGDDYQTLFSYQGSSPDTLIHLAEKYRAEKLETSYRIPQKVYTFAKGITYLLEKKIEKDFVPAKGVKGFVWEISDRYVLARRIENDITEHGFPPNRWYLLFRNNCFIDTIKIMFTDMVIPFHTANGFCIDDISLKKIKRYYNFRKKGFSTPEVFNAFCKKYGIRDINEEFCTSNLIPGEEGYIYHMYYEKYGIDALMEMASKEPSVLLSTTHKVKGGEADYVVLFMDCTKKVYYNLTENTDDELRVLYVAATRARTGLYLAPSESSYSIEKIIEVVKEMA